MERFDKKLDIRKNGMGGNTKERSLESSDACPTYPFKNFGYVKGHHTRLTDSLRTMIKIDKSHIDDLR